MTARIRAAGALALPLPWPVAIVPGALAALGQPPWSLLYLAWPAFAVGLWMVAASRRPILAGWALGLGHFAVALHWIVHPFLVDPAATGWLAPVGLIALAGGLALFWGLGAGLGARLGGARLAPLGAAAGLGLAELARAYVFTGFPWALPGHVLIETPALAAAAWLGAHGLGAAVLLAAGLAALTPGSRGPRGRLGLPLLALAVGAAPFLLAAASAPAPSPAADAPVVRLVQPNAPQARKWDPDWIPVFWQRGLELTARPGDVDAVIWPETSLPVLLGEGADVAGSATLRSMLVGASGGVPVAIGAQRYDADGRPRNALAVLDGTGGVAAIYDKHRLVPFGEYLPLPRLFGTLGLGPLAARLAGRYAAGDGPATLDLPGLGRATPLVCYEAIFPQDVRARSGAERPDLLLHVTNDAWFGPSAGPRQHLALARLRAAESGLPLVRAANTGISAVVDARGGVRASLPLGTAGVVDHAVPPPMPPTPYARVGDWGALLLYVVAAGALLALGRRGAIDPPSESP